MSTSIKVERQMPTSTQDQPPNFMRPLEFADDASPDQNQGAKDESQYPQGLPKFLIIASVTLAYVLTSMDSTIVSVVVPSLTDEFHTTRDIGWYSSAYRLCVCSFQFMFGKLYKMLPAKNIFLTSVVVFRLGSVVCATAKTSAAFVVGRAICGFAASAVMAGGLALLVLCVPMRKRPLYTGIVGVIILFAEQFGAALFVSAAQNIFQIRLKGNLQMAVPQLNATSVESVGLSSLKTLVDPWDMGLVLEAVDKSVAQTWYLAVGLACLTVVGSATMEWKSVKEKQI